MARRQHSVVNVYTIRKQLDTTQAFFSSSAIDKIQALARIIVGKRANGKSFDILSKTIKDFHERGRQTAYVRRWDVDLMSVNTQNLFKSHVSCGVVEALTGGEYDDVKYWNKAWYLVKTDKETGEQKRHNVPFMCGLSLNSAEHYKSGLSLPMCFRMFFDEFIALAGKYLPNEWSIWANMYSTIKRNKPDDEFELYMVGNTINPFNPYFQNMGLMHIEQQEKGTIQVYDYANGTSVAVELTAEEGPDNPKQNNKLLHAFDDPTLKMITDGVWEFERFPLMKDKDMGEDFDIISKENAVFSFYTVFDDYILKHIIVNDSKGTYCLTHQQKKELTLDDYRDCLIYQEEPSIRPNVRDTFRQPRDEIDREINRMYMCNLFRYSDNFTGNLLKNYLSIYT